MQLLWRDREILRMDDLERAAETRTSSDAADSASVWPRRWTKKWAYCIAGTVLAMGSPTGLLALRAALPSARVSASWIILEIRHDCATYAYLAIATHSCSDTWGGAWGVRVTNWRVRPPRTL